MAAARFIPVIGWAGRAAKGGNAVYKTVKGLNAADHALDAYKSTKAMDILKQTEAGLYGLSAANGLGEAVTGKDMFGNELTEEQRQTSLMTALGITGIAGAAKAADKMASGTKLIPYSKEYVQNKVQKAQGTIKDMGKAIGKVEVPTGVKIRTVADTTGNTYKHISVDKTTIKDLAQKITAKSEGSKGTGEDLKKVSDISDDIIKDGSHISEAGKLKPNIKYQAGEYDYQYKTDDLGRITEFNTDDLNLTERDSRLPHKSNTPGKAHGDHAGHLAADRFGGSPDLDNLVSQSSSVNLSKYKKLENQWTKAITGGKKVSVNVKVNYDGMNERPSDFEIMYEIDGEPDFIKLKN